MGIKNKDIGQKFMAKFLFFQTETDVGKDEEISYLFIYASFG